MPIDRAGMLKAPVDRNPTRPPGFEANFFRARGVAAVVENIEILAGKNVPVAVEKRFAQMLGQRLERLAIARVVGVDRVVAEPRANEIVVIGVVARRLVIASGRLVIDPERFLREIFKNFSLFLDSLCFQEHSALIPSVYFPPER